MAEIFAKPLLLPKALLLEFPLPSLFYGLGPVLAVLFVYAGVDELAVAIVLGYPAGARGTRTGRRRTRRGPGGGCRGVEVQSPVTVSGSWPAAEPPAGIRRACLTVDISLGLRQSGYHPIARK